MPLGGRGNDSIDGNRGADTGFMGPGNDTLLAAGSIQLFVDGALVR